MLNQIHLNSSQKIGSAVLVVFLAILITLGWRQFNATASELPTLDDSILQEKALVLAHNFGLEGEPESTKIVRMTLADSEKLTDSELGKDAGQFGLTNNMPVFVMALRGKVEPTGPRQIDPANPNPKYDRMLIVLNAHNGDMILQGEYYVDAPMPIEPE